jgi:hypothetical protein
MLALAQRLGGLEANISGQLNELQGLFSGATSHLSELDQRLRQLHDQLDGIVVSTSPILAYDYKLNLVYLTHRLPYPIFNPSVARWNDEIVFVSRSST